MNAHKNNETSFYATSAPDAETSDTLKAPSSLQAALLPFAAGAFTLVIFAIDALTPLNIAIAVLYGAVILMASYTWSAQAIVVLTVLCLTLTLVAYGMGHRLDFFGPAFGRCMVSLAAIAITALLALKGQASKNAILQAKEALRKADRRKDEFLAMLAHELRNPLAPISSAAHYLQTGKPSPQRIADVSDIIIRQVTHLNGLVDDLLDVSRITRRIATLSKERVDLKKVVSEAVEQVQPLVRSNNLGLTLRLAPEAVFVYGDHKRLVQVLSNLLHNAVKFTPAGGAVFLHLDADDEQVSIRIRDTGIGMTADSLPHVFEWFVQAERGLDRTQGGLGIGLPLARSLVEMHDGRLTGSSPGLGQGSEFSVVLPRMRVPLTSVTPPRRKLPSPDAGKLRIMVVDDNIPAAKMLAMYLASMGHQVSEEYGSVSALERARCEQPDVYLLDIGLPEMDGNELARRLRADARTRDALMIAVSGYGQEQDKQRAMEAGFDHYLVKPVDTVRLHALLEEAEQARQQVTGRDEEIIVL